MEMNHNALDVEVCKREGLPYFDSESGVPHNLEEYLQMGDELLEKLLQLDM